MTVEQRRRIVDTFDKAMLIRGDTKQPSSNLQFSSAATSKSTSVSIAPEDSGIVTLPIVTLQGMWRKAACY